MNEYKTIHFKSAIDFRNWLLKNHEICQGIWMLYYKKHTGKANILYSEALDEALCFGWIDSLVKRIDEDTYVRKFTPRSLKSNWSNVNKIKVLKLLDEGRMRETGLQKIESYRTKGVVDWDLSTLKSESKMPYLIPEYIFQRLKGQELAYERFLGLSQGQQNTYAQWIDSAKKEETRQNRLSEMLHLLLANKKLGLK